MGAEPVRCDLENVGTGHLAGAEAVVHGAAFVESWGPPDAWDRINVGGTERMLAAARAAGTRRFVHIGTEAAIVRGQDVRGGDETAPLALDSPYPYCRTKAAAEKAVREANAPGAGFETIVLRPRFIWGPGDQTLLPAIRHMAANGRWMWIDHGQAMTSTVFIDNLAEAIVMALDHGRPGEAYYILDDGDRSLREIISGMALASGVNLPDRSIPRWTADLMAAGFEAAWRLFNLSGAPPLTRHAAMVASRHCTLKGEKARAELGYAPAGSVEEGLRRLRAASG